MDPLPQQRLAALFENYQAQILAFACRRCESFADAEEIAAETFVVAWRRLDHIPAPPLPWLYGVARRLIANQRRGNKRKVLLTNKLIQAHIPSSFLNAGVDDQLLEALSRLNAADRELLALVAWEELSHNDIALVLGISPNAVAIRLHRARIRLDRQLSAHQVKGSALMRTLRWYKGRSESRQKEARP